MDRRHHVYTWSVISVVLASCVMQSGVAVADSSSRENLAWLRSITRVAIPIASVRPHNNSQPISSQSKQCQGGTCTSGQCSSGTCSSGGRASGGGGGSGRGLGGGSGRGLGGGLGAGLGAGLAGLGQTMQNLLPLLMIALLTQQQNGNQQSQPAALPNQTPVPTSVPGGTMTPGSSAIPANGGNSLFPPVSLNM